MPYATNTDIAAEFPALAANGGFTTTTRVTAAQVDEFCTRASAFIDAKIGGKYTTPVLLASSPSAFSLLKEICCWLVYSRVAPIVGLPSGEAKTSTGGGSKPDYAKKAAETLKEIQSGTMVLSDAPLATAADGAESYTNDNADTLQPPNFTREGDNW